MNKITLYPTLARYAEKPDEWLEALNTPEEAALFEAGCLTGNYFKDRRYTITPNGLTQFKLWQGENLAQYVYTLRNILQQAAALIETHVIDAPGRAEVIAQIKAALLMDNIRVDIAPGDFVYVYDLHSRLPEIVEEVSDTGLVVVKDKTTGVKLVTDISRVRLYSKRG